MSTSNVPDTPVELSCSVDVIRIAILLMPQRCSHRCVLVHGVFEVWGYGPTKEDAVEDAIRLVPMSAL